MKNVVLLRMFFVIIASMIYTFFTNRVLYNCVDVYHDPNYDGPIYDTNNRQSDPTLAIFYNLFVPASGNVSNVFDIVKQQIYQIGNHTSNQTQNGRKINTLLYYNTIAGGGGGGETIKTFLEGECSNWSHMRCNHLKHHSEGFEMLTLSSLWHYCQTNPKHTVSYIHPKGSFHNHIGNHKWRIQLTAGALHDQCIDPPDSQCNVCGSNFQAAWGPLYLGNMWTAKCSYVKKLMNPFHVEERYIAAYGAKPASMTTLLFRYGAFSIPKGRYVAEMFIGTHPDIVPCGITEDNKGNESSTTSWSMMPQDKFPANLNKQHKHYGKIVSGHKHRTEWFLLPGLLWRSYFIYDTIPPADSWVWSYYPDSEIWKELLHNTSKNFTVPEALETMANLSYKID